MLNLARFYGDNLGYWIPSMHLYDGASIVDAKSMAGRKAARSKGISQESTIDVERLFN